MRYPLNNEKFIHKIGYDSVLNPINMKITNNAIKDLSDFKYLFNTFISSLKIPKEYFDTDLL